jgi:YD repeat-containing protein
MIRRYLPAILIALTCTSALSAAERWRGRYGSGRAPIMRNPQYVESPETYVEDSISTGREPVYDDGVRQFSGRTSSFRDTTQSFGRTGTYAGRAPGFRENRRYYGARGATGGHTETEGNVTLYFDSRGRLVGQSEVFGGTTRYYDARGRYTGRTR